MSSVMQFAFHKSKLILVFRHMYPAAYARNRTMVSVSTEVSEELKRNPYYDKYSQKIREIQKASPRPMEFKSQFEESKNKKLETKFGPGSEGGFSSVLDPKEKLRDKIQAGRKPKTLDDVMKLELIEDKSSVEIMQIWEDYHKSRDRIAATIPYELYDTMHERGKKFPIFVFPLPRGHGYEFFLCHIADHEMHFTSLINYQAHKENAPECLTMIHYTEMKKKGIVLMHGEFNKDVIDVKEAQCLANQYQLYYGRENEKRLKMLDRFNYSPNEFKHMDLIAELECLSL